MMNKNKLKKFCLIGSVAGAIISMGMFSKGSYESYGLFRDENGVYQIGTPEDLNEFSKGVNNGSITMPANAVLTKDIELNPGKEITKEKVENADGSESDFGNSLEKFTPIGTDNNQYQGTFEGNGKTINGLYISGEGDNIVGLFGNVSKEVNINDLKLENFYIRSRKNTEENVCAGAYIGYVNKGSRVKIIGSSCRGAIKMENLEGGVIAGGNIGFVSQGSKVTIDSSVQEVEMDVTSNESDTAIRSSHLKDSAIVGGNIGYVWASSIEITGSSCKGDISVKSGNGASAGKSIGYFFGGEVKITGSSCEGDISIKSNNDVSVGRNIGYFSGGGATITGISCKGDINVRSFGEDSEAGVNVGGSIGYAMLTEDLTIDGSEEEGAISVISEQLVSVGGHIGIVEASGYIEEFGRRLEVKITNSGYKNGLITVKSKKKNVSVGGSIGEVGDELLIKINKSDFNGDFDIEATKDIFIGKDIGSKGEEVIIDGGLSDVMEHINGGKIKMSSNGEFNIILKDLIIDGDAKIYTADGLRFFGEKINSGEMPTDTNAILMDDIDLNPNMIINKDGTVEGGDPVVFVPIGTVDVPYNGSFDGNGKTIKGLYVIGQDYAGLFGVVGCEQNMRNLKIENSYVSGKIEVGGLIGVVFSDAKVNVIDSKYIGGVGIREVDGVPMYGEGHIGGQVGYVGQGATLNMSNCESYVRLLGGEKVFKGVFIGGVDESASVNIEIIGEKCILENSEELGEIKFVGKESGVVNISQVNCDFEKLTAEDSVEALQTAEEEEIGVIVEDEEIGFEEK